MFKPGNQIRTRVLPLQATSSAVAAGLSHLPGLVFLDSSSAESIGVQARGRNRAIIAASPTDIHRGNIRDPRDREKLRSVLKKHEVNGLDLGFPLGGLIGWVEYEGDFVFGEYPEMLIFDYSTSQWTEMGKLSEQLDLEAEEKLPVFDQPLAFEPSIDRETYLAMVRRAKEYIASGDIYQVNLTHRFQAPWRGSTEDAFALYQKLRNVSPAPFSGFLSLDERTVLSSSPELFLRISGRTIKTRPIKGTRPRFHDRDQDEKSAYDLITSPKEISELIMITDLERNDLGQICEFGTVEATELLQLERYAQVFHLVSTVTGNLRSDVDHVAALQACFPGGSITGAPKKRAREIIEELETAPRGLYTGTIGCFGFNGESVFNIVIRTAICEAETIHFHVGAGIVADSSPESEWEETLTKAEGILRAAAD